MAHLFPLRVVHSKPLCLVHFIPFWVVHLKPLCPVHFIPFWVVHLKPFWVVQLNRCHQQRIARYQMTLAVKTSVLLSSSTIFMNPFRLFRKSLHHALSFVAHIIKTPYLCPIKTEVPKLYESSPFDRACTKRFPDDLQ